jgi:type III secretory pathway component EscR
MNILVNKETCFLKLNINLTVIEQRFGRKLIPPIDPSMNLKTLSFFFIHHLATTTNVYQKEKKKWGLLFKKYIDVIIRR